MIRAALILACAIVSTAEAAVVSNVTYARTRNGEPIFLDWHVPDDATGALPTVIYVHGGGWAIGDKSIGPVPDEILDSHIVAAINYRLTTESASGNNQSRGTWPTQIQDVRAAIRFVRQQAGTNIAGTDATVDPNRIGLYGESAGGHLAIFAALTADDRALDNPPLTLAQNEAISCAVKTVATSVPVLDLRTPTEGLAPYQTLLLAGGVSAAAASPIMRTRSGAPPIFILNRDSDELIEASQATAFEAAQDGVTVRTQPGEHNEALSAGDEAAIVDFFEATL